MLALKGIRGKTEARLKLTGRDINTFTLGLLRDEQTGLWHCTGEVADDDDDRPARSSRASQPSTSRQEILDLLAEKGGMTPAEVAKELGKPRENVKQILLKLSQEKTVSKDSRGHYSLADSHPSL